jgi:hypothetical protein
LFNAASQHIEDDEYRNEVKNAFIGYFGGLDEDTDNPIGEPEKYEIVCRCLDRRFDDIELKDSLVTSFNETVAEGNYEVECEYCGSMFRPYSHGDTTYVCSSDACEEQLDAELLGLTLEQFQEYEQIREEDGTEAAREYYRENTTNDLSES